MKKQETPCAEAGAFDNAPADFRMGRAASTRIGFRRICAGLTCLGLAVTAIPRDALAIDTNSADYFPLPAETNLLIYYAQYATRNEYVSTNGTTISDDTGLDSYINIIRYVHYMDVAGFLGGRSSHSARRNFVQRSDRRR